MKTYSRTGILLLLIFTLYACQKPTENIKIVVDTDVIKHTAMINATDATTGNPAPKDATITISGTEAANVYELSGKKDIRLSSGMVTIGLSPNVQLVAGKPITVGVSIAASGYTRETKQVIFTAEQKQQVINIPLSKIGSTAPPIVLPPPPVYNTVSLTFTGKCPNRGDLEIRPSVYVYFKKTGTSLPFQYLGYVDKGKISTEFLALNETYDFQIAFNGETYKVSQKIEQSSYDLDIEMGSACNF